MEAIALERGTAITIGAARAPSKGLEGRPFRPSAIARTAIEIPRISSVVYSDLARGAAAAAPK